MTKIKTATEKLLIIGKNSDKVQVLMLNAK